MFKTTQKRILFYILFLTVMFLVLIGMFNYIYAQKIVVSKDEQRVSIMTKATADNISHFLTMRGQLAWSIAQNSTVLSFANSEHYRNENLYQNKDYLNLRTTFNNFTLYYPEINTFYIAVLSHDRLYANIEREKYPDDYDIQERPYFKAVKNKNKLVYTDPYWEPFTEQRVITAAMPFYNNTGDMLGVAAVDISESSIKKMLNDIPYLEGGYSFILNNDNIFVEHPNDDYYLKSLDDLKVDEGSCIEQIITKEQLGISKGVVNGEQKYICYQPIKNTDWTLGIVLPTRTVTDPINSIGKTSLLIILIAIFILSYLIILLISRITNPINQFTATIKKIEKGDYTARVKLDNTDEFTEFANSLNSSIEKQQRLLNHTIDSALKINLAGNEMEMLIGGSRSTLSMLSFNSENATDDEHDLRIEHLALINIIDNIVNQITLIAFNNQLIFNSINDQKWEETYKNALKNTEILNEVDQFIYDFIPTVKNVILKDKINTQILATIEQQLISVKNIQLEYLNKAHNISGDLLQLSNELINMASTFKAES